MKILLIETSTACCSVALGENGSIISSRRSEESRAHAALTAVYIQEILDECGLRAQDLDAVAVSSGPGSYTGLRVGVSSAKGLAFGAGIPLIAVDTLEVLAMGALQEGLVTEDVQTLIPLLDARRMEVYSARFSPRGERLSPIEAIVVGEESFAEELACGKVLFVGDGADKCREVIRQETALFAQRYPLATAMLPSAEAAYQAKRFEDVAYFEPFYLKEFVATVSRKNLFQ